MKNNTRILFGLLVWFLSIVLLGIAHSQEAVQEDVMEFARKSLEGYVKNVITEQNFSKFGFKSLKESHASRLGEPYRVMIIGLKDLKAYKPGTGAKPLLLDAKTLWFPVMIDSETRTKIEIIEKEGKWIAGEFGKVKTAQEIAKVKEQIPGLLESKDIKSPYKILLLKIPALYAEFLYVESPQGEFLIPAMVQPQRYGLQNAQIYAADDVLYGLREFAKEIDEKKVM